MKIATLGPKGTFSHEAALKYDKNADIEFVKTGRAVFEKIDEKEADVGIVPIENSVSGTIGLTLDAVMDFELNIIWEEILPIKHNLAGLGNMKDIKVIYCHPQTYAQCESFIRKNLADADIIEVASNAMSVQIVSSKKDKEKAAIIPEIASQIYNLDIIKKNIQDNKFNITRFIIISSKESEKTGNDRTSIAIYPQADKPGLLYNLLGEFAKRNINLTKIESRPSKGKLGDYIFFIDFEGHKNDKKVQEVFSTVEKNFFLKILGSYPKKY